MALNMLRLNAKFGEICVFASHFCKGHFQEIGIAELPLKLKSCHVEKFRECRLTDVGESNELKDKKNMRKKSKHKIEFKERAI